MTDRRAFIRAGGLVATGLAVAATTAEPASAAAPAAALPLLNWHCALANRRYEPAVVAVIGSSTSEGVGVSRYGRGYVHMLTQNLRAAFPVPGAAGGDNYAAAWGRLAGSWPVTLSGGPARASSTGWGLKAVRMHRAGQSATYTFTGTSLQVWYSIFRGGGTFSVTIDGDTVAPAVGTDAARTDRNATWSSGALSPGRHTVVVTCLSPGAGGAVCLHGFAAFDGDEECGIRVYNGGHGGKTSGDFACGPDAWAPRLRTVRPHLVILQLGLNDWFRGVPAATVKHHLQTIIAAVRSHTDTDPSFVIYGSPRVSTGTPAQDFALFTRAWRDVAAEDTGGYGGGSAVAYFDLAGRQVAPSYDNSLRLYCDDRLHTNDRGAAFTADALAGFLAP